jgi:dUTP pyrophosphatase
MDERLRVKLLNDDARVPQRQSADAAGYDLHSCESIVVFARSRAKIRTGIAIALPKDTYGRVAPRSSLAYTRGIDVGAGVIDQDYRGEIGVIVFNHSDEDVEVKIGDRVAQLIIHRIATPEVEIVDEFDWTERGTGAFGSTGR